MLKQPLEKYRKFAVLGLHNYGPNLGAAPGLRRAVDRFGHLQPTAAVLA